MSLTKGQIHKLKGKLSRVNPDSPKAKRIRIQLGLEPAPVVEVAPEPAPAPAPVVEPAPEPVVEVAPAVEVAEVVVEEPAPAPKKKRTYRRRKTAKTNTTKE